MNILCIDCPYTKEIESMGHKVLAPDFQPGVVYLPAILQMNNFKPDLLIHYERLSARVIMGGMEKIQCPTVFVSVDSHINMFWHKYYGRLFDLVLTPHMSFFNALDKEERLPAVQRMASTGYRRLFKKFDKRTHNLTFSGVTTEFRPSRTAMLSLLKDSVGLYSPDAIIPHEEMLNLYMDSQMIPNECIGREVNYRLFEGASCGSLVLSPNIGEDQNAHFEPGVEFEPYEHGLELVEKVRFYQKNRSLAERIGQAGWQRVQAHHLPEHRARQLVELVSSVTRRRAEGEEARMYFWLTLAQLSRHGTHPLPAEWFLNYKEQLPDSGLVSAMKLRFLMEASHSGNPLFSPENASAYRGEAVELLRQILANKWYEDSLDCNLAGAMAALSLERPVWARAFWQRQIEGMEKSGNAVYVAKAPLEEVYDNYMAWGKLLMSLGRDAQSGFKFLRNGGTLPSSAFECMIIARDLATSSQDSWLPELHKICARVPGFSFWDMGLLAELSLKYQDKWLYQLQYGYNSIENFRVEAGLFELEEARKKAKEQGEIESCNTMLEGLPSSGYILSSLFRG